MSFKVFNRECFSNDMCCEAITNALHETDTFKRRMMYLAVGYGIGLMVIESGVDINKTAELTLKVKQITNKLNESILVNTLELEAIIMNVIKFYNRFINKDYSNVATAHCLNTLAGFDQIFSQEEAIAINENFTRFALVLNTARTGLTNLLKN